MTVVVAQRMWQRRDTAANWTSVNPTLNAGEIGFQIDVGQPIKMKVGNGTSAWNSLSEFNHVNVGAQQASAELTALAGLGTTGFLKRTGVAAFVAASLIASDIPNLDTAKITSGTFADARIAATNVTQHQAALSINYSQLVGTPPPLLITKTSVVASQAAQLALTAQEGDVAVRTDLNKSYIHNGGVAGTMADWTELLTPTDSVLSFNGRTGAITLTSADVTTALTYTPLNAASYTAADVLSKLLTVDGSGSGIDADLLDGQHGAYYLPAASYTAADVLAKLLTVDGAGSGIDADLLDGQNGAYYLPAASYTAADVLSKLLTVDGAGTGIDADLLDGQQGAYYADIAARLGYTPLNAASPSFSGTMSGPAVTLTGALIGDSVRGLATSGHTLNVYQPTTDGTDNARVAIHGGGSVSNSRGAYILVHGNEFASDPGRLTLVSGLDADLRLVAAGLGDLLLETGGGLCLINGNEAYHAGNFAPGTLTASTTNSVSGGTHTHAITGFASLAAANVYNAAKQTVNNTAGLADWEITIAGAAAGGIAADVSTPRLIVYGSSGSSIQFRPDGRGSASGQATLSSAGSLTLTGVPVAASTNMLALQATIQNTVTTGFSGVVTSFGSAAAAFNTASLHHFLAQAWTPGAGHTITDQYGFRVGAMDEATNNFGFTSSIAAGNGWNFYGNGSAPNYLAGQLRLGSTTDKGAGYPLQVSGGGILVDSVGSLIQLSGSVLPAIGAAVVATIARSTSSGAGCRFNLIGGNAGTTGINIGDTDAEDAAGWLYDHAAETMYWRTAGAARLQLLAGSINPVTSGSLSLGTSALPFGDQHGSGAEYRTGVHSPAAWTANQDNFAVSAGARVLRASGTAARNLTGIVAAAGRFLVISNVGTFNITLIHDLTSTAANRFLCPGNVNYVLTPNSSVEVWYDSASSRWRVIT